MRLEVTSLVTPAGGPIDLIVEAGSCVCLSGSSGAGKTLFLRALADLDPHSGAVSLDGRPSETFAPEHWRRLVGLLPTDSAWWADTVASHFLDADHLAFQQLGLPPKALDWPIERLSTGERQRLALLRLLGNRPQVLLLDEPTGSLDPKNTRRVEKLIANYRAETSAAVLWVSHDPGQVGALADRYYRLADGRLREQRFS